MRDITFKEAIREAILLEMRKDPTVILIGEDIGQYGGIFQITAGMLDEFGADRVIDTPISELAILGAGIGSALYGCKPIVEVMFADFLTIVMDQIVNNAAKMNYSYDENIRVPLVIRTAYGAGTRSGMHHCQNLEGWFADVPGLKVVIPSDAYSAKGLMTAAIRDPNPVLFFEHKLLYGTRCETPEEEYVLALGKARVLREGNDLTIVAWGSMVRKALLAANALEKQGFGTEVIDLCSIVPFDKKTILDSVKKTSRLLIAQESHASGGFGSEIAATVAEEAIGYLDAPIRRIGAPFTPVPFSPVLEDSYIPNEHQIIKAALEMLAANSNS